MAFVGLALLVGCRHDPVEITGLRITTAWNALDVDQLEFTVIELGQEGGPSESLIERLRRPEIPRSLVSGADLVINFPDRLGGARVLCDVRALLRGEVVGTAQVSARLITRVLVEVQAMLTAGPGANVDGAPCTDASQCASHVCSDGVCCHTECRGTCRSCAVPGKQGTCALVPEGITHPMCATQGAGTCGYDGTCDGLGACRMAPAGTKCREGACKDSSVTAAWACDGKGECVPGPVLTCAPFNCDPSGSPHCFAACSGPAECVPGRECIDGSCGKKLEGAACMTGGECASGFCVEGVCCDSKCDGPCQSCRQVGSPGSCRPVPSGVKDPRNQCPDQGAKTCGTSGSCDGAGHCARYSAGTVCQPPSCMNATVQLTPGRCDGAGTCVPGGPLACAPFGCSSTSGTCNPSCTRAGDCAPGVACKLESRSCGAKGLGQPCEANSECASAHCVDKVCCQDACQGPCRSCALGAVPGICTLALAGSPDPRATCKDLGKGSCDTDGTCAGDGTCRLYPQGTVCASGSCDSTNNVRMLPSTCDKGVCTAGAVASCGNYRCNGPACFGGCSDVSNCAPPNVCIAGACVKKGSGTPCTKPKDCDAPYTCVGSTCQLRPLGQACAKNEECGSAQCTDGVCCTDGACGACRSCNVSGFVGFCHPLPAGTQDATCTVSPIDSCGNDGTCDGAGKCRVYPAGTPCGPASCNGQIRNKPRLCDGVGTCKDSGTTDCAPYTCNPATADCYRSCDEDSQCCCGKCRGNHSCL